MTTSEAEAPVHQTSMAKLEQDTGLLFPPGSAILEFYMPDRVVDPVWVAKIVIPLTSAEEFKHLVFSKTSESVVYHGALADSVGWWNPTNIVLSRQYLADRHTFVRVVLSEDADGCIAFIECAVF